MCTAYNVIEKEVITHKENTERKSEKINFFTIRSLSRRISETYHSEVLVSAVWSR